ncbi:MAG: nucleotide exchange factor GrpE [Planctomycetes bacterium]|nr:nucleotide exchange factor GrpE [Planctomycetota bacterium]
MSTEQKQDNGNSPVPPAPESAAGTEAGGAAGATVEEQLQAALAERDSFSQKWLLAVADMENYRRRILKEMEQDRRYAVLPLARDLLPALDNLHRALDAAKTGGDVAQLASGVQMVAKQIDEILSRHSITAINAAGQPFDPNLHQAIQQVPAPGKPAMSVLNELERGYRMHDRVVRPSTVVVVAPEG